MIFLEGNIVYLEKVPRILGKGTEAEWCVTLDLYCCDFEGNRVYKESSVLAVKGCRFLV